PDLQSIFVRIPSYSAPAVGIALSWHGAALDGSAGGEVRLRALRIPSHSFCRSMFDTGRGRTRYPLMLWVATVAASITWRTSACLAFTPHSMIRQWPNQPAAANPAVTARLQFARHRRGVAEPRR